ncbi:DAD family-domain-containing protein [Boletus coccyginus]|nr:DAD family-domain-containing protein [Boletus coccyginus]
MAGPKPSSQTTLSHTVSALWKSYLHKTPERLKFIDAFLTFIVLSGVFQFAYCVLVTNFPFNAFLAGFASSVGQFVLTASLRAQVNPENRSEFKDVSPERCVLPPFIAVHAWPTRTYRAFADFALGSIVLHFFVFNFLG